MAEKPRKLDLGTKWVLPNPPPVHVIGKSSGKLDPGGAPAVPRLPQVKLASGLFVPMSARPPTHEAPYVTRLRTKAILAQAEAGEYTREDMEFLSGPCPELLRLMGGPLADLRTELGHVGAFLEDVSLEVSIGYPPDRRNRVRESLAAFETRVKTFYDECRRAEELLIPPAGQTRDQYVLHLLGLAEEALLTARRYVAWECGSEIYLYKDQRDIKQIQADDFRVKRALKQEMDHLKRTAELIAAREQGEVETTASPTPAEEPQRPAFMRDHFWLRLHTKEKRGPASIRDFWDGLSDEQRKAICPRACGRVGGNDPNTRRAGRETVKRGLRQARSEVENGRGPKSIPGIPGPIPDS
jgi:hypothetical protein